MNLEIEGKVERLSHEVATELFRAMSKHGPMHGPHEGKAVIEEEYDELWDEVKKKNPSRERMREEAIQIAAMAMRFVIDVCDKETNEFGIRCA